MLKVGDKIVVTNAYPGQARTSQTGKIVFIEYDEGCGPYLFEVDIVGEHYSFYKDEIEKIG